MIKIKHKGDFSKTEKFFNNVRNRSYLNVLSKYGREGVSALSAATPKDTGATASSWNFEITDNGSKSIIAFTNSNVNRGVNIAIILQYGHGTRNGGYVAGRDYINPAIQPIFDKIADEAWKEVTKS